MIKLILALLYICILFSEAKHLLRKSHSKAISCNHPFVIRSLQYNLRPLTLINIMYDSQKVAKYADLQLSASTTATTTWCQLDDKRIQNVETGLYLNVHGPGLFCWAANSCQFSAQVDVYYTQGTSWYWGDVSVTYKTLTSTATYHQLQTMGRTLIALPGGTVNLGVVDNNNLAELWHFEFTK